MLKRITSILCIIPFLMPITFNIHNYSKFQMAEVEKEYSYERISPIEQVLLDYNKEQYIKMIDEMKLGLTKQYEEKVEAERIELLKKSKTNVVHYNPYNLREVSNINVDRLYEMLEGKNIQYLAPYFVQYEEEYGINCFGVLGIVSLESGFGTSNRANNGSNNLTGHAVYSGTSRGSSFDSWESCIRESFRLLADDYLSPNGKYFKGYSIWNVNVRYSQSNQWASQINQIIRDLSK